LARARGFSVGIHVVGGAPEGLWTVTKGNWDGLGLRCTRPLFKEFRGRPELARAGIYLLVGEADSGTPRLYIGEAEVLAHRLANHHADTERAWWTHFVAFTRKDESLNKAHVRYLESKLVSLAQAAKRATLENGTAPPAKRLTEAEMDDLETYLEHLLQLLPLMGIKEFQPVAKSDTATTYTFKRKGHEATGQYQPDGFVVLAGSTGPLDETASFQGTSEQRLRHRLLQDGTLTKDGQLVRLARDYAFTSPSAAAGVMAGTGYNGWVVWKDGQGRTLHENERAATQEAT
jgi:hypothetical protein